MKVALVGFGTAGEARVAAYRSVPTASVTAVVDPSPLRRARARALLPGVTTYTHLNALLDRGAVDVVDICAPPVHHAPYAALALTSGHHVICEKPVAFLDEEARGLAELSRQHGRLFYPAHNYHFSPMMAELTAGMSGDRDGAPMDLTIEILRPRHAAGVTAWQADWRTDAALAGGGILLDHGSHCIYMATRLFGGTPDKVSCRMQLDPGAPAGAGVDLATELEMTFPAGVCRVHLSWISTVRSNRYTLYTATRATDIHDDVVTVDGPAGRTRRALRSPTESSTHEEWFAAMFADFTEVLADRAEWERPLGEAVSTVRVTEAAYASARHDGLPRSLR
ncbi:Gfo/Idh/MocA family oxidoreductase [Streptomyces sp. NPDC006430]|uniref:Gfo/Idh/MocA family protein n=1 Tax=Streptomyces sp. NPDC006430 TaxID=3154299 RepID=UPI0033AF0EC2